MAEIKVLDKTQVCMIKTDDARVIGELVKGKWITQEALNDGTGLTEREPNLEYREKVNIPLSYLEDVLKLIKRAKLKEVRAVRLHVSSDVPIKIEALNSNEGGKVLMTAWIAPRLED